MTTLIVEKEIVDLKNNQRTKLFAVACSEPNEFTEKFSLTFESYLTPWSEKTIAKDIQNKIEGLEVCPDCGHTPETGAGFTCKMD